MKKLIAMLLALTLALGLAACGGNNSAENTTDTTAGQQQAKAPENALEILATVWDSYGENEKFFAMGGDYTNLVENAPGNHSLEDEGITGTLLVPAEQVANIKEAASLVHGMMLNNFTCGVFRLNPGADAKAFADGMHQKIAANPWICGTPERLVIAVIGGEYVLAGFGVNDAIGPFVSKLTAAYPQAELKYDEAIAG